MSGIIANHENTGFAEFFQCDYLPALNPSSHPVVGDAIDKRIHFLFCFLRRFRISPDQPNGFRRRISVIQQFLNCNAEIVSAFLAIPDYRDLLSFQILYTRVDES